MLTRPQQPTPLRTAGLDAACLVLLRLDDTRLHPRSLSAVDVDPHYCLDAPSFIAAGSCLAHLGAGYTAQREVTR